VTRVHEADFPAEQPEAQTAPWFPLAHGHQERPESAGSPPRQGPQTRLRLITTPTSNQAGHAPDKASNQPLVAVERLRARREFLFVADGAFERRKLLVVQARRRPEARNGAGAGFTATKKVGSSVIRNRARRRLREAVRLLLPLHGVPGADYVFIARQDTGSAPWTRLLDDMESALISLRRRLAAEGGPGPDAGNPSTARG
jgi:ribonuclease P protein component